MSCEDFQRQADELADKFLAQRAKSMAEHIEDEIAAARKVEAKFVLDCMKARNAALVLDLDTNRWVVRYPDGDVLTFAVDSPDGLLLAEIADAA